MSNRAVCYTRSSRDRHDVSLDAQRRALHELALQRSLVIVDEFADAVESGKDEDRPAFQRLLASLKDPLRGWEHVLVLDTSRVARRRLIAMMFEADCTKRGVRIIYKSLPESDPATDMVLRSVLQAFDEYHSLISRAKGLAGMAENVRQGWRAGGKAPRGYVLEHHATGAIRDGAPVTKTKLALDDALAPIVQAYLRLRAQGVPRGTAIARLRLPWDASSTNSMDWQALTYAGHTVWGVHSDLVGQKRRPRHEWTIQRGTHPPLITDPEAEAIMAQCERAATGRRLRASPLLLTGLLVTPAGEPWHSDGCGHYRVGKGRKVAAHRVESAVLARLAEDLSADDTVDLIRAGLLDLVDGEPVDKRRIAGLEKRAATVATQIGRTVDLAASLEDPAPVLRRVADLEHQRAKLIAELVDLQARSVGQVSARTVTATDVRQLVRRLFVEISAAAQDSDQRSEARLALHEVLERIEMDPAQRETPATLHYAVQAGVILATPSRSAQAPVVRWSSGPVKLPVKRLRAG